MRRALTLGHKGRTPLMQRCQAPRRYASFTGALTGTTDGATGSAALYHALLSSPNTTRHQSAADDGHVFARHWLPNMRTASLFVEKKREDGLFSQHRQRHHDAARARRRHSRSAQILGDKPMTTAVEAVRVVPALLAEAARIVELSRVQEGENTMRSAQHRRRTALSASSVFCRSVLEQALVRLYLVEGNKKKNGALDNALLDMLSPVYGVRYEALPVDLQEALAYTLSVVMSASAFSFHLAFEQLARRKHHVPLALELFHLWWLVNPDQFVVELPDRMLPTLQSGSSAAHERGTTPGLDAITSCLRLYVSRLTDDDISAIQRQGGFLSADVLLPENYREALRSSLQQLQYRKYHVSTSLVTRVVQLCMASSTEGESGRAQEITRDVLQTYMQDILCRRSLTRDARAVGEKYDEWLLLSSVMLAVGIFERHAKLLRQLPRRSAAKRDGNDVGVSDIRCYDDLIQSIRTEWLSYISKLAQTQPHSPTSREDREALESTMRLVFTTVSLCYETCGILNRVSANRPATASRFWQLLHERIAHTFPHVMHTGSTVSTVWALTALEGMTSSIPSGSSLPFSSVGVEHAVATWRQLTSLQHHGVTESEKEPGGTAAVVDDMKGLEKGHGIMPVAERQKRSQYVVAHVCGMDAPVVGDASLPLRSSYRYRTGFHLPLPSFASKLSAPPLLTADHTQCAASDEKTCDALAEARASVLDVFRLHSTLPMPADPLLTLHDKNNNNNDIFLAEEIRGMTSSPSFHVFLKLVQVLSLWGEPTNGSSHQAVPGLLFSYIEHDIAKDCKPIISGYLKRLCVQHLAHSGLPGAVALITSHRSDMDALPPALAWNRLLHALLWSCLPASALGKLQDCLAANEEDDTSPTLLLSVLAQDGATTFNSFGSGSLAWTVIRAHCEDAHAQLSGPAPSDDGDAATEVDATAAAEVKRRSSAAAFHQDALTTLSAILAHAVSLSFNISDDARRVVCLSGMTARCEWPVAGDMEPQAAADLADVADDVSGDHHSFADTTDMTAMGDENHQQHDDEDDSGEGAWLDTMDMSLDTPPAADDEEMTGSPGATKPLFAARPNDVNTTEEVVNNVVDDGDGGNTSSTIDSETEGGPTSGDVKCLLRHITWNPPGAQHLFFSVLQAIAWIVKPPPAADRSTEAYGFLTAGAPAAERIQWARCLASNYMLALQCYLPPQDIIQNRRVDALGRRIMHDPAVLEKLMLLLLHTCPDCTLLSLMLVHWCDMRYRGELQGSTTTMEEASSFIVLPRSVEGSLCQVLYHAGITASTAQQWRQQVLGTTEGKMLSSDFQTLHALHSDAVSKHCAAVLQQSGNEEGDATPDALADAAAAELSLVLGSIALLALEQRAARIGGSPHPHNYYVYAFLKAPSSASVPSSLRASSVSAASQVVCPSQQLMSFSPVKAPPQQAQQWRETWQRGLSAPLRLRLSRNVGGSRSRVDEGQQLVRSVDTSRLVADDSDEEEGYIQRVSLF